MIKNRNFPMVIIEPQFQLHMANKELKKLDFNQKKTRGPKYKMIIMNLNRKHSKLDFENNTFEYL
jgi:hypothetical protein